MDLPGVDPKSIRVSMDKGMLEISGERKPAEFQEGEPVYHRHERVQGAFKRSFKLPESADAAEITAKSEHGVLNVEIKKRAEQQPRRITIN
jgi:HSP20 family protein